MRTHVEALVLSGALLFPLARARPMDDRAAGAAMTAQDPGATAGENALPPEAAPPASPQPTQPPPAPPPGAPAPPAEAQAQPSQPVPPGQWVYTQQYGWVWMPYGSAYTYAPPGGYGQPYMYVYYPAYGWTWLVAPWVWGFGPWPYFGVFGPHRFAWYGYGWWRYPWRWHFAATPFVGFGFHGVRPAPYWGGFRYGAGFRGGLGFGRGAVGWGGRGRR